jgi:hypothetical protein
MKTRWLEKDLQEEPLQRSNLLISFLHNLLFINPGAAAAPDFSSELQRITGLKKPKNY